MSLETLLEAAEFIEWRSKDTPTNNFHPYAKKASVAPVVIEKIESSSSFDFEEDEEDPTRHIRRPGGAGTREVHNKLEKNRRAHLKECFNFLKKSIPSLEDRRTSNLGILRGSLRYIQALRRKDREHEAEMQRLAKEKIGLQARINNLKLELQKMNIDVDLNAWMHAHATDNESHSTSTATEGATPPPSDHGEFDDDEEEADLLAMETNPSPIPKVAPKRLPSVRELLYNGTSSKVADAVQGLMAANKVTVSQNSVRPLLPYLPKSTSTVTPETPSTFALKSSAPQLIIAKHIIPGLTVTPSGAVTQQMQTQPATVARPPVTQILHQTLTQRQALQKQSITNTQVVSAAPFIGTKLKSAPTSKTPVPITMTPATASLGLVKDGIAAPTTPMKFIAAPANFTTTPMKPETSVSSSVNLMSLPLKFETTMSSGGQEVKQVTSAPVSLSVPFYMASLPKLAHPILMTSLTAPTLAALVSSNTTSVAVTPVTTIKTETASSGSETIVTTSTSAPVLSITQISTSSNLSNAPLAAGLQVRPSLGPNLLSTPLLPLIMQNIPQTSISTTSSSATITTTVSGQFTTVPLMSLAQMSPLTQLVSPMTVMSPGMQLGSAGLTQTQLNNMFAASSLLKQFPVISPLLQSGQVLGQQVVKPFVVVCMPNAPVVTTTSISLPTSSAIVKTD